MPTSRNGDCTRVEDCLYVALELSNSKWKIACSTGPGRKPRQRDLGGGAWLGLLREIQEAKKRFGLPSDARVVCCYEAGRDGFWLHRFLCQKGIENIVVDSSSIEVSRRSRRPKTDRLDVQKLLNMLIRWDQGEEDVWSVVHPPSIQQEDARQLHRELEALKREQTRHNNRLKSLLVSMGIQVSKIDRNFPRLVEEAQLWDGNGLPENLKKRMLREFERMQLVNRQIRDLEKRRAEEIRQQLKREEQQEAGDPQLEMVCGLLRLVAIGPASSWLFVHEVFGWRKVANRRQLASLLGLVPTPYNSGGSERDQGISKSGNRRMRTMSIEIAWCWLRWQPQSALSQWYMKRFGQGSKRQRRIGIVALARKLMIALWKFQREGEIPTGARLRDGPYPFSYTPSLS